MSENWKDYIKLCAIPDIGAITAMRLIEAFGSPAAALSASKDELMRVEKIGEKTANSIIENRDLINMEKICDRMNRLGARYIDFSNPDYSRLLNTAPDKPIGFYAIGDCNFNAPCISIVGTRNCSAYGLTTARKFAATFARAGFTIVSGMARGIDTAAHYGALDAGGKTIAVLGCGADVIYPPENIDLYKKIIENGAVISEFPLGTRTDRQTFPIRNRIIAGLSLATIVVESDTRGGSMQTARLAGEYGREVFAIPGRIDSSSSNGCNALIRDGVTLASRPEDVIDSLTFSGQLKIDFEPPKKVRKSDIQANNNSAERTDATEADLNIRNTPKSSSNKTTASSAPAISLSEDEAKIYGAIKSAEEIGVDGLTEICQLPVSKCLSTLLMLEIKKLITKTNAATWKLRSL